VTKLPVTAVTAGALSAAALALAAAAAAAPSGPSNVVQTVNQLKADGYTVMINKVGAAPLDQCTVAAVRAGQTYSRSDSGTPGAQDDIHTTVTAKTVFVDLKC
jgi:protein-disulfide isomerase